MQTVLLVVHLIIALLLIGTILLQRSEGGALGIGGSGGGGGNLFTARGVGNGLTRATAVLAVGFFITSIGLTVLATRKAPTGSVFDNVPVTEGQATPSAPKTPDGSALPKLGQEPVAPATPAVPATPAAPAVPTNN
jgi:preprotein translocase subunit SecG